MYLKKFNVYFWETERERQRERQSMIRGVAEKEGNTESRAGSRLWAVSTQPNMGLELTSCEIMTWAEVGHLTNWATQVPHVPNYFCWGSAPPTLSQTYRFPWIMFHALLQSIVKTPFLEITFVLMLSLDWKGSFLVEWRRDGGQIMNGDRKN